ncbi:hypothetical protein CYMTET_26624 [Cymbomonas tetramitiformis]|uniref:Uncharacterized protein n=1 Tax=Cymbomonas tetramitiformis TaxID=36881 RepID=A0AAE0FSY4_9CHLO|nr:hypothetical protein CYMTET_26624 [Cymbomonas tetramitiformis]
MITISGKELLVPKPSDRRPELNFEDQEEKTLADDLLQRANIVKKLMKPRSGMEVATKPAILKLVKVQRDGVVVLEDNTKLREKSTVQNARLLPADVGPHRAVSAGREQPWQAPLTSRQTEKLDGTMGDLPDRVEWGDQEVLSKVIKELMPGH